MSAIHNLSNLSIEEISQEGEAVGREYDIYNPNGEADVEGLVSKLGGSIVLLSGIGSTHELSRELLSVYDEGKFRINIASNTYKSFDRLNTARALGHYFIHFLGERARSHDGITPRQAIFRPTSGEDRRHYMALGRQTKAFAGGLLLPEAFLKDNHSDSPEKIAKRLTLPKSFVDDRYHAILNKN